MPSLYEIKELEVADTPVVLFECSVRGGGTYRWSSHAVELEGQAYESRVLRHDAFELRFGTDRMTDANARITVTLANTDSSLSQGEAVRTWKGATLTARFAFFNLVTGDATSEIRVLFRGVCTGVDEITETGVRLSFSNRLAMQRAWLPNIRLQRRCPWLFPASAEQRTAAAGGGEEGRYSPFFKCGYSAGVAGGAGNLQGTSPYAGCGYTLEDCASRGMLDTDEGLQVTRRFGGVPLLAESKEEYVPLVYGTGWVRGLVMSARNDGKSTQYEVLLSAGPISGVQKLVANGYEIPEGQSVAVTSGTGWYRLASHGDRSGVSASELGGAGGPHGSMAYVVLSLPNTLLRSGSAVSIDALVDGMVLPRYGEDGQYFDETFTSNPSWIALDVLRRSGWLLSEIDVTSFARVANYCDETVNAVDKDGATISLARYRCHLTLQNRASIGEVLRSIRSGSGLFLRYAQDGRLELAAEASIAVQQPVKPAGSNSVNLLNGGWPAYEFGDGTHGFSGIARRANGEPGLRFSSRNTADSPNRYTLDFVDEFNLFQTDGASLVDVDDVERTGQEVQGSVGTTGIGNYHQAIRILKRQLGKSVPGNYYVEFLTSVRGVSLRPGDIITMTYLKEGLDRVPLRVLSIAPSLNYASVQVMAQLHQDEWYDEGGLATSSGQPQPGARQAPPRPLGGTHLDADGIAQYGLTERSVELADGGGLTVLSADFAAPATPSGNFSGVPLMSLTAQVSATGGTLVGGRSVYYGISAVDADGAEGSLSSLTRAVLPAGTTCSVTLTGMVLPAEGVAFHVYRGEDPFHLTRIASSVPAASSYADTGDAASFVLPPDANYHHANFYWREELQPPVVAGICSALTVGSGVLTMPANSFAGKNIRITKGTGIGQERRIVSNTATTLTVEPRWDVIPDGTSFFCVTEGGWHFGGRSETSTVDFEVPNRTGLVVHVNGRAANSQNQETDAAGAPVSRWFLGGAAGSELDAAPPPTPSFGLSTSGKGSLEIAAIGFATLTNTRGIDTGTLNVHYWNELSSASAYTLAAAVSSGDTVLDISVAGPAGVGSYIQIGTEILRVQSVTSGGTRYQVNRGVMATTAVNHASGDKVNHLGVTTAILSFPHDFFGSLASGQYEQSIRLPNVRVVAAELAMTNSKGTGAAGQQAYTLLANQGLRTLSGGQFSLESTGYLAMETGAAPLLIVDAGHAVRDVFARVAEAPTGGAVELELKLNGCNYCSLTIAAGATISNVVNGSLLGALPASGILTLDITSVPTGSTDSPGRDLTVTVRL